MWKSGEHKEKLGTIQKSSAKSKMATEDSGRAFFKLKHT